jgi:hypothetical protein
MKPQLTESNQRTYDAIFGHPMARHVLWHEVYALLGELGEVVTQPNGHHKATCNGQTLVLHPEHDRTVAHVDELMSIRHFLEKIADDTVAADAGGTHLLVVIDHREARVYKTQLHGTVPQRITPLDTSGFGRQLHYVQDDSNGQRKPELKSFYEAVVKTLQGAETILIFGSGTGSSSAMTHLVEELKHYHAQLATHIVGAVVLDPQHMSEDQLLAAAREFYAKPKPVAAMPIPS